VAAARHQAAAAISAAKWHGGASGGCDVISWWRGMAYRRDRHGEPWRRHRVAASEICESRIIKKNIEAKRLRDVTACWRKRHRGARRGSGGLARIIRWQRVTRQ